MQRALVEGFHPWRRLCRSAVLALGKEAARSLWCSSVCDTGTVSSMPGVPGTKPDALEIVGVSGVRRQLTPALDRSREHVCLALSGALARGSPPTPVALVPSCPAALRCLKGEAGGGSAGVDAKATGLMREMEAEAWAQGRLTDADRECERRVSMGAGMHVLFPSAGGGGWEEG